ncbi:expressed unknown protein [Seminavis robusta]|uniref:Uncharacterized protein n=1 Tax=Seminavis robusta TaxID=568900 RepID=A0A9N8E026_9STRA|nr:expressed unknown protein [Seminavis robusta]|eukprot:Sro513_g157760.1 n/a (208) ;mRNA; r:10889-11512
MWIRFTNFDMKYFESLVNLQDLSLDISDNKLCSDNGEHSVGGLASLSELSKLESLSMLFYGCFDCCSELPFLDELGSLPKIRQLELDIGASRFSKLSSLDNLAITLLRLRGLERLKVWAQNCSELADSSFLSFCKVLEECENKSCQLDLEFMLRDNREAATYRSVFPRSTSIYPSTNARRGERREHEVPRDYRGTIADLIVHGPTIG